MLNESVSGDLGRFVREIMREIIRDIKLQKSPRNYVIPIPRSSKSKNRLDYGNIWVRVKAEASHEFENINAKGSFKFEPHEGPFIFLKIEIPYYALNEIDKYLSEIYKKASAVLRHEAEHGYQLFSKTDYERVQKEDDDFQNVRNYFLSKQEIAAYVAQMMFQAKQKKEPFEERMEKVLSKIEEKFHKNYPNKDPHEIGELLSMIRNAWKKYAQRRFHLTF